LVTLGFQNALGGFLLAIIGGNEARFVEAVDSKRESEAFPMKRAA
jgi:hypothetical protein